MNADNENPKNVWSARFENVKNVVQTITLAAHAIALIVAAIWSYYTFVKPEIFRPDDYRSHIHLDLKLESLRVSSDLTLATLGIHVSNKSRRFLRILAAHYELNGFNYFLTERNPEENPGLSNIADALNKNPKSIMRWDLLAISKYSMISIGRILPEPWWFAPEETYSYQMVVAVPCDVNALRMDLILHYAHADSEIFHGQWMESKETLRYKIEIKEYEKYVYYDPDTRDEHREIEEEYGLRSEILVTEIDIPWEPTTDKCQ